MNRNLYKILTIGLSISLAFMLAGFAFGMFSNTNEGNIIETSEGNIKLDQIIHGLKTNEELGPWLLSSIGILIMIAIPAAIVLYSLIFFLIKRNYKLCLISAGVLIVLVLSAIAGFLV